ncbi:mucin-like protein isoform X3 [Orbicella faveolata]|uniref:mucin-like protein isoform X3 n=1 Tax=Orbicella faveolata TaxID=48498 RepID=UPI0009E23DB9|nr:mucin-like protein isoform X3 [Orbicella faveolata]
MNVLQCECLNGYTGTSCESDLDACEANLNPCYPGVSCVDLPPPANISGYKCGPCPSGFTGDGSKCEDFDECLNSGPSECKQICINTPGSFVCDCYKGYLLNIDQRTCDDINECVPASDCMHKCKNFDGGYNCSCDDFFKVDPVNSKNCIPESPCQDGNHDCQHICFLSLNNIQNCACRRGYLLADDGKTCKDNDECATDENRCNQKCNNTEGSYLCSCVNDFRLDTDNVTCKDIDECLEWTFQCSDASQRCVNTQGSYKCKCEDGLYWINETCKGLGKGEEPPPPPPAPTPRKPSLEETLQSVIITLEGLSASQWNLPKEEDFKGAVADSVTTFCANVGDCITERNRQRRALDYIIFTSDQVHLLPGFPEQDVHPLRIRLAIYVQFPPGVAQDSSTTLTKNTLLTVISESREKLEKALNVTIINITAAFFDASTEGSSTVTPPVYREKTMKDYFIIGGAVVGFLFVVVLSVLILRKCCFPR